MDEWRNPIWRMLQRQLVAAAVASAQWPKIWRAWRDWFEKVREFLVASRLPQLPKAPCTARRVALSVQ